MRQFLIFCLAIAASQVLYEHLQIIRPTDYSVAFERWWFMTSGALLWLCVWRATA